MPLRRPLVDTMEGCTNANTCTRKKKGPPSTIVVPCRDEAFPPLSRRVTRSSSISSSSSYSDVVVGIPTEVQVVKPRRAPNVLRLLEKHHAMSDAAKGHPVVQVQGQDKSLRQSKPVNMQKHKMKPKGQEVVTAPTREELEIIEQGDEVLAALSSFLVAQARQATSQRQLQGKDKGQLHDNNNDNDTAMHHQESSIRRASVQCSSRNVTETVRVLQIYRPSVRRSMSVPDMINMEPVPVSTRDLHENTITRTSIRRKSLHDMINMEPVPCSARILHENMITSTRRMSLNGTQHENEKLGTHTLRHEIGVDFSSPSRPNTATTFVPSIPRFHNSSRPALDTNKTPNPNMKLKQLRPSLIKLFPGNEPSYHSSSSGNHTMSSTTTTTSSPNYNYSNTYNYNSRPLESAMRLTSSNNKVDEDLTMTKSISTMDHHPERHHPHVTFSLDNTLSPTPLEAPTPPLPLRPRKWRLFRRNSLC
jgi:hypothetical protein